MELAYKDIPFLLFPENVWEIMLDSMHSGRDVQNMFIAYPELGVRFHHKKTVWLFDLVCPHLLRMFPELDRRNVADQCRQVSEHWRSAIDKLERK